MIIYNVTLNVEDQIREEWLEWMRETHIPEVLQTGLFKGHKFLRLLDDADENRTGTTYAVQYYLESVEDFLAYTEHFAPALQEKTQAKYGERVLGFRTLLEEV